MFWDYLESTLQLILTIVMLLGCLFQYINSKKRGWIYLVLFFLGTLVSSYHWTAYLIIMGEQPNTTDAISYIGWNFAFAALLLLLWQLKTQEERRYFHPLMLLPIPINIYQLTLYLPFGGEANSIYQVTVLTAVACLALQSILWHRKRKQDGPEKILPAIAALYFVCCEFAMWTTSCFGEPIGKLYYLFSILASLGYFFLLWSVRRYYRVDNQTDEISGVQRENILKAVYFTMVVLLCAFGGIIVGNWMRDTITASQQEGSGISAYDTIPVVLLVFSLIIVIFAVATLIIARFSSRTEGAGKTVPADGETSGDLKYAELAESPDHRTGGKDTTAFRTEKSRRSNLILPLLIILCLMIGMVVYTSQVINQVTVTNLHEVGEDRISGVSAELETYLDSNKSVVRVAADTVDYMVRTGSTTEEILKYIQEETAILAKQFNENYTGLYGYIKGEYLDGLAWEPPEGYEPTQRAWYTEAVDGAGEIIIVPPYLDAQTGDIVISICRQLTDKKNVLSLDMTMNNIQEMAKDLKIREKGFGFIMNRDGMIIAHADEEKKGTYLTETEEEKEFMRRVLETRDGYFEMDIEGKSSTVFVRPILDQWFVIIAISNEELYAEHWKQLTVNVLMCTMIFILIAIFYYLGNKNEQNFSRRMEEMKIEEQRQAYETRVLKLEKEAADQANKAKSDFLAEMSHEIRTPINAVLGMNEMILRECERTEDGLPGADHEDAFRSIGSCAANIENAGNNLLAIINDILDFSKIEAGRMEISEGRYELSSLLSDVSNMVSFRAREKGLDFRIDADEAIPDALYGDKVRVRQVITNLLSNAVKYTDRGSIRLQVRSEEKKYTAGGAITLLITVADTGIGIREEEIGSLFEKFQRLDLTRNSTIEGTGLGLAITHSLVTMMDGTISVESEYGKGSAFTVTLPQKVVSCEPMGNIKATEAGRGTGAKKYRESFRAPEARILIVDDTLMNLEVTVGLLKKTGVRTDTAQSGQEALQLLKKTAYDAVIMDQRMPGMDGTEVLRRLRGMPDHPNEKTPVICMTADAIIGARERYTAEGFTDYLPKPVSSETLERMLLKYLPKEKVTKVRQAETDITETMPESIPEDRYRPLQEAGMNAGTGLAYCQQDAAFYESLLKEYARSAPEKSRNMQQYFESRDWKQYGIQVHALKSTSRMIGAETLAKAAEALEKAAKEENGSYITSHHSGTMEQYRITAEAAAKVAGTDGMDEPEDEILEFAPEE